MTEATLELRHLGGGGSSATTMIQPAADSSSCSHIVEELDRAEAEAVVEESNGPRHEFSLPPVDRGKDAYLFLLACFMVEGLVWGMFVLVRKRKGREKKRREGSRSLRW